MISNILKQRLAPIIEAEKNLRKHRITALAIGIACSIGVMLWLANQFAGFGGPGLVLVWIIGSIGLLVAMWNWLGTRPVDLLPVARKLEERFPELDGRLLTAIEVEGEDESGEHLSYLEERVVFEAVDHSVPQLLGPRLPS